MSPTVSVCVPCHNAASYIGDALDSLLSQTWPHLEIIVVDDGSTDGSIEVLAQYTGEGIQIIKEKFGSAAKARNRALLEATGSYIKFFDADDLLSPEMIERQVKRLEGRQDAIASAEWGRFYSNDLSTFRPNPESVWKDMEPTDWIIESWQDGHSMTQPGLFLIPMEILQATGGWDEELTLVDDFEFYARVMCQSREVLFTQGATIYYRSGISGNLSGRQSREAIESAYRAFNRGIDHLLERRDDKAARQACANVLQSFLYHFYYQRSDLTQLAEDRIRLLGGSSLPFPGSSRIAWLSRLVGWKTASQLSRCLMKNNPCI